MEERQDEDHSRVGTESLREPRAPACSLHPFVILRFPHFSTHYDTEVPTCWTSTVLVRCTAYYSTRTALTLHTVSVSHLLVLLPYSFPTHTRTPALVVLALVLVLVLLNSTLYVRHRPAHREKGRARRSLFSPCVFFSFSPRLGSFLPVNVRGRTKLRLPPRVALTVRSARDSGRRRLQRGGGERDGKKSGLLFLVLFLVLFFCVCVCVLRRSLRQFEHAFCARTYVLPECKRCSHKLEGTSFGEFLST